MTDGAIAFLKMAQIPIASMPAELLSTEHLSEDERLQRQCDSFNNSIGTYTGYECPVCKNKGSILVVKNGSLVTRICKCMDVRRTLDNIKKSGLSGVIEKYTFDTYNVSEPWQQKIKQSALNFTQDNNRKWFYIGGQSGCGKTHICTAIAGYFLKQMMMPVKYMLWRDESVRILANTVNDEERQELIYPIKNTTVLYIDDFLKHRAGERPKDAETNLAYEILNYRCINPKLITLISSELSMDDIIDIDEALGGRIKQMTAPLYMFTISADRKKNFRLKD